MQIFFSCILATPSSRIISDDAKTVQDLYVVVIECLKKASAVCAPASATPFFDPEIKQEVPDGVNNRGKH